jgi:YVTN family beta-propeller protein
MAKVTPDGRLALITNAMFSLAGSPLVPSSVSVIDLTSLQHIDEIPVEIGPNGIDIDSTGQLAYVGNARSNTVSAIDIPARTVIATIPVGRHPSRVALSPDGRFLVVTNFRDATITTIDTLTLAPLHTILIGDPRLTEPAPEFGAGDTTTVAITSQGVAFVTNWRSSEIHVVALASGAILRSFSVVTNPFDIRIDERRRLIIVATYSSDSDKRLVVMDLITGAIITNIPLDGTAFPVGRCQRA